MTYKFIINLPNRKTRLINTISELERVSLGENIIRELAVTSDEAYEKRYQYLSYEAIKNIKNPKSTQIIPSYKALACAISHINVWKKILDLDLKYAIVVEDDILIKDIEKFKIWYNNIKNNIDLEKNENNGYFVTFGSKILDIENENNNYYNQYTDNISNLNIENESIENIRGRFMSSHFYFINQNMIKYLLQNIHNLTYQIDIQIGIIAGKILTTYRTEFKHHKFLNINTNCIQQNTNYISDIQFYKISPKELFSILNKKYNVPLELIEKIIFFIPDIYKI
jgi:GR25 family glycosyltransferase involved in LPS biosynthesis